MIGGLLQLSRRTGMPCPKGIRRLIRQNPDFPVLETGKRGRAYQFDLNAAVAFIEQLQAQSGMSAARWEAAMTSLGLDLDTTIVTDGVGNTDTTDGVGNTYVTPFIIDQRDPFTREPP
jgi:hypothetical protein